jgi:hypothetical protein
MVASFGLCLKYEVTLWIKKQERPYLLALKIHKTMAGAGYEYSGARTTSATAVVRG